MKNPTKPKCDTKEREKGGERDSCLLHFSPYYLRIHTYTYTCVEAYTTYTHIQKVCYAVCIHSETKLTFSYVYSQCPYSLESTGYRVVQ